MKVNEDHSVSFVWPLYYALLLANGAAAAYGLIIAGVLWTESSKSEPWALLALPLWALGGLAIMLPLLIATFVCVAVAREKIVPMARWAPLALITIGMLGCASPFAEASNMVLAPLVQFFKP